MLHSILSEKILCYNVYLSSAALCSCCIMSIESYLQIDKSIITRELLRCKKLTTNSSNALKQALEALPMPLQAVHYEFSSEILDANRDEHVGDEIWNNPSKPNA